MSIVKCVVSARALEKVDLIKRVSTAASIATLTWHDLEPKMLDEQFLVPMANLILCFKLKIGYSRICACTKIPVFCLPPGPADENKGSRPSLTALQTELLLLNLNGVRRNELVAPYSNSSSSGAD